MKPVYKLLIGSGLLLVLLLGLWSRAVSAAPSLLDPRINRIESEVRSLQSEVRRLQGQISRTSNRTAPNIDAPIPAEPSFDQQFDTLAILIIELQQRVSALEASMGETTESVE